MSLRQRGGKGSVAEFSNEKWAFPLDLYLRNQYCVSNVYFMLADLNEILVQLRHFCGTFRRLSATVPYHSVFFPWVEAVMSLVSPKLGLSGGVPRFFSFNQFIACIVLVAHNIVEIQSERE